jgi:Phosphotransferase enzyme family
MPSTVQTLARKVWRRLHSDGSSKPVLRHCDWRFLLPMPAGGVFDHLVVLGAPRGLSETILRAEIARRVSESPPEDASADALIILRHSKVGVAKAARCLRPDGVVYWEVDRRVPRRWATSVRSGFRALRAAGLSPLSAYALRPGCRNPQIYLPLGDDSVLRWYLKTNFAATSLQGRSNEILLRLSWAFGVGLRERLISSFALTATAGTERRAPAILDHPDLHRDLWRSVRRPRGSGRLSDLELLLMTGGRDDWNRVVAMPFPPGGTDPLAVLKLSRVPDRNVHTEKEQRVLAEIRPAVDAELRRTLPEAFGTFRWKGLTVGLESYVSGRLLAATSARWGNSLSRKIDDLNLAVQWLIEFHRQTELRRAAWGDAEMSSWTEQAFDRYEAVFGLTADEKRLFDEARHRCRDLAGMRFPIVWYHYAFSTWNICRQNDDIGVFDWESADRGPALFDLIYLVFRWNQELSQSRGRGGALRASRELFLNASNGHPSSRAIHKAIERYMSALDIERRAFPVALISLWTFHAITRAERARSLLQAGDDIRRGNAYVSYLGVLAEDADQLFRLW